MPTPPTPPTPKKTPLPPGVVELLKTLDTPPGAPPVDIPLPSQPDVGAARIELMDAMRRGVARQLGPGTDAAFAQDVGAADLLKPIQVVPKTPTWGESMARALLPQITVVDERPVAPEDLTPSTATVRPVNTTEQRVDAAKQAVKRQAATMATLPFKPLEYLSSWAFGTPSDALETALVGPSQQVPLSQVAGGLGRAMLSPTSETGKMLAPVASPIAAALIGTERAALGSEEYRRRYVDQVRDDDEIPLAAENTALYALRVLGTAAPALVTEGLLRLPVGVDVPAVKAAAARARQTFDAIVRGQKEGTASELAGAAVDVVTATPFTFGELLGAPAGHNVRVRREGEAARYAEGVLERIENGDGLEVDLARAATNRLGPEYADTGWWAGLVLDVLTNWEGAVTKPGAAAAKLARDVGTLRTLRGGSVFDNIRAAALNPTVDIAERTVRPLVADLEQGKAALTDVRPELLAQLQPFLDDLARQRKGMTFEEVALVDGWRGVGVGEATEEYARRLNAAKAKEAEAVAASRALARRADEGVEEARGPDLGPTPDRGFTPAKTPEEVAAEGVGGTARVAPPRTRAPKVTAGLAEFYTLRNKGGDAIESGDFETVSQLAQRRRLEGDTVYRGGDVPIARWEAGDAGVQRLVTTPVASDVEAALFSRVPPAPALRQFRTPADRAFANAVVDVLTDAPALGRRGPPASDAGRILEDAVRMWARDRLGADELVALPNGALVTPRDRAQIVEPVQAALERAGLVAGKTPNAAAVQELAARWGYDLPPTGIRTAEQLRGLRNAGISFEGRGLADWRSRVRGQPAFHRRMLEAIATLHTDQKVAGRARAAIKPYVGWLTKAFLDDPAIRLPPQVKTVWKETRNQLERVADDLFGEVEQALAAERKRLGLRWLETMDPAPVLRKFMAHEARLAGDEVRRAELPHEGMSTAALDAEVDAVVGDPRFPAWAVESTDPLVRRAGLAGWSERVLAERDAVARRYLRAALESGGVTDIVGTNLGERLAGLDRELLGEVWRELFERGLLDGPATKGAVQQLAPKVTIEPGVAALSFLAHKRADDIVNAQLARLGEAGVVVPEGTYRMRNPRDQGVLGAMLRGDHRSMVDGRWTYHYPPAAIAWAERTLDAMGLEAGSGAVLRPLTLGGNETVWVPNYLHPQLESMLAAGRLRPAVVRSAYAKLEQLWKTNALQGVVVPNPTFFTGQLLSIVPQLWTTRGAAGAATGPARLLTHGREVGELMRRLGGPESYHTPPASPFDGAVVTRQGEVWAMNDLEAVLRDAGMADTRAAVETGPELQKVLDRETAFLQRAGLPLRVVNDTVRNVAGSIDQAARLGVFLDDVLAGIPPATAAQNARKALLDYRDLTEFERTWMRRIFTFYAYMRKTSDATIEAMFTHPERFAQQARLWHQYQTFGLTAEEKGQLRDEDIARVFLPDWPMRVGKYVPPPIYKGLRPQSTPVGPSENLAVLLTLGAPFLVPDRVLEGLAPIPAIGAAAFQGVSITGEGFDTPEKNVIPPVLMDNPITGDILRGLVAAGPEEITADDWHRGRYPSVSATAANLGRPSYWSAGSGLEVKGTSKQLAARTLWQSIRMAAARTPTSAEGLARGAGALEPTPYTQQDQEALAWLLGMRLVPAPTATEARRRAEATYTGKVKRAARDLAPPSGAR